MTIQFDMFGSFINLLPNSEDIIALPAAPEFCGECGVITMVRPSYEGSESWICENAQECDCCDAIGHDICGDCGRILDHCECIRCERCGDVDCDAHKLCGDCGDTYGVFRFCDECYLCENCCSCSLWDDDDECSNGNGIAKCEDPTHEHIADTPSRIYGWHYNAKTLFADVAQNGGPVYEESGMGYYACWIEPNGDIIATQGHTYLGYSRSWSIGRVRIALNGKGDYRGNKVLDVEIGRNGCTTDQAKAILDIIEEFGVEDMGYSTSLTYKRETDAQAFVSAFCKDWVIARPVTESLKDEVFGIATVKDDRRYASNSDDIRAAYMLRRYGVK